MEKEERVDQPKDRDPGKGLTPLLSALCDLILSSKADKEANKAIALKLMDQLAENGKSTEVIVEQGEDKGTSWLMYAIVSNDVEVCQRVLKLLEGKKIRLGVMASVITADGHSGKGTTPLYWALKSIVLGSEVDKEAIKAIALKLMDQLVENGKSLEGIAEQGQEKGMSWLMYAIVSNDVEVCQRVLKLLESKKIPLEVMASVITADGHSGEGTTPLYWALSNCGRGRPEAKEKINKAIALELMDQLTKNQKSLAGKAVQGEGKGLSWLTLALWNGDDDIRQRVLKLLEGGKIPTAVMASVITDVGHPGEGTTPLYWALNNCGRGRPEAEKKINKAIALELMDQLTKNQESLAGIAEQGKGKGMSWLMLAIGSGDVEICQRVLKLIEGGKIPHEVMTSVITVDGHSGEGKTALSEALFLHVTDSPVIRATSKAIALELIKRGVIDSLDLNISDSTSPGAKILKLVKSLTGENNIELLQAIVERKQSQLQQRKLSKSKKEKDNHNEQFNMASQIKTQPKVRERIYLDVEKLGIEDIRILRQITEGRVHLKLLSLKKLKNNKRLEMLINAFKKSSLELNEFRLSDSYITTDFATIIVSKVLGTNHTKILCMQNCKMDKGCLKKILGSIGKPNSTIEQLELSGCDISINSDVKQVARIIRENLSLVKIILKDCQITEEGMKFLIDGLKERLKKGKGCPKLEIDVRDNDFDSKAWQAKYDALLSEDRSSKIIVNETLPRSVSTGSSEEKMAPQKQPQVSIEYQPYYPAVSSNRGRERRRGPRVCRDNPNQPAQSGQSRKSKPKPKVKQNSKKNKNYSSLRTQGSSLPEQRQAKGKRDWDPTFGSLGGKVFYHPKFRVFDNETEHLPRQDDEQKYLEGNRNGKFLKKSGIFARQKTLGNVNNIDMFKKNHIQPLKDTLDFEVKEEELKNAKKYALCMDIALYGEAVGEGGFADCFNEKMVESLRHMRHVFFKCFLEVDRFSLDELVALGNKLVEIFQKKSKLSSNERESARQVWSEICKIDVSDKSEEVKGKIKADCDAAITQLSGKADKDPVYNRACQFLRACRGKATPASDFGDRRLDSSMRHGP